MNKKSFKDIEHIIKAAADAHEQPFNEGSWKNMEKLLDMDKDRKRPFFWIFRFAMLATIIFASLVLYLNISQPGKDKPAKRQTTEEIGKKNKTDTKSTAPLFNMQQDEQSVSGKQDIDVVNENTPLVKSSLQDKNKKIAGNEPDWEKKYTDLLIENKKNKRINQLSVNQKGNIRVQKNSPYGILSVTNTGRENIYGVNKKKYDDIGKLKINITAPEQQYENIFNTDSYLTNEKGSLVNEETKETEAAGTKFKDVIEDKKKDKKPDTPAIANNSKPEKSNKKRFISGFYLTGMSGVQTSGTRLLIFSNSTVSPVYGFGIGHRISKRLSVQAGFYSSRKKYVAGPGDYKVKAGSYLSRADIKSIKADCLVYDVPVTLQYTLIIRPKTVYYVSAGISSYLMKKENYDFTILRNNALYTYPYRYSKNSNLLAVINISAGLEKKIFNKLYLQAAPVVTIPLGGVGEGKVRLYSTNLNVGLKYFPFKK